MAHTWRWRAEEPFEGREAAAVTEKDCTPIWRDMSGRNEREKCTKNIYTMSSILSFYLVYTALWNSLPKNPFVIAYSRGTLVQRIRGLQGGYQEPLCVQRAKALQRSGTLFSYY